MKLSLALASSFALATACTGLVSVAKADSAALTTTRLRTEYAENPVGLGTTAPRLSWELRSGKRGAKQSAYQILVAENPDDLKANRGTTWDSGKIATAQTAQIVYAGSPLHSGERCWWKVHVWDGDGKDAGWSAPASFEIGLLSPSDWKGAQWVTIPSERDNRDPFSGAHWIWTKEAVGHDAPIGERTFERHLDLPADAKIAKATISITADDQFNLAINGKTAVVGATDYESWKRPRTVDVTAFLQPGSNTLTVTATNTTVSPAGVLAALQVTFADGRTPTIVMSDRQWTTGGAAASEIALYGGGAWGHQINMTGAEGGNDGGPGRYLRKGFTVSKPIRSARLYATALGIYEPFINGQRVGNDVFAPGWTDYNKRVQYQSYDVTSLVKNGDNAVGLIVSDGWYTGHIGLASRGMYGKKPVACGMLRIDYADGSSDTVVTDATWRGTATGPVLAADLQSGESYDARKEIDDWSAAKFDASAWQPVQVDSAIPAISCDAQRGPAVRKTQELPARSVRESAPGHYLFDLGQNMVGWARLKVQGPAGAKVTLRFAEMLNKDGTIYTTNYRGARCIDEYTLRGDRKGETFDPQFTFRGFRYVEVTGWPSTKAPDASAIVGVVAGSDTPRTGVMATSSPMVNQLLSNIDWGQRGNFLSVPTDCPQRDERLGWMGDAQIFVRTATYNRDVAGFFNKWMVDVDDAQTANGAFTDVSPHVGSVGAGTAAWGDAGVICPWTIYLAYGDTRILENCYPGMQHWVEYCQTHSRDLVRPAQGYGDWLSIAADTPKDVLATAYFAYSTHLTAETARALGKTDDAAKYDALFDQIKAAFNTAFVGPDGRIKGNTQTDYVLALRFNLLPESQRATAAQYLADDVHAKGDHLSTGFVGVGYLCPTLTATGHDDVAYELLNQKTFPSWGYSIQYGATTIWERWDGWTDTKGFQSPSMNSFNHYSLGSVGEWLYDSVAGIAPDPADPGFHHLLIHPQPGGGLTWANADFDSIHGPVASHWKQDGNKLNLDLTIPANTSATVWIPTTDATGVTEGGKKADGADGVHYLRTENGFALYEVQSGTYKFATTVADGVGKSVAVR